MESFESGSVPSHRLFGLAELAKSGWTTTIVRAPGDPSTRRWHLAQGPIFWRLIIVLGAWSSSPDWQVAFAATEAAALPLLLARRLGLLRRPIVLAAIALSATSQRRGVRGRLWRFALDQASTVVTYDRSRAEDAAATYPKATVRFLPLGIDVDWFTPDGPPPTRDSRTVLSVGTNEGKDFPTLLGALPDDADVVIVTDEVNAEIVRRLAPEVEPRSHVPIEELRDLYRSTTLLVLPLREAQQSSGQTVLLENMACGTPVIVSEVPSVQDYVVDGKTAVLVPPGDVDALRAAITDLLAEPEERTRLGANAARAAREGASAARFGAHLSAILAEAAGVQDPSEIHPSRTKSPPEETRP